MYIKRTPGVVRGRDTARSGFWGRLDSHPQIQFAGLWSTPTMGASVPPDGWGGVGHGGTLNVRSKHSGIFARRSIANKSL